MASETVIVGCRLPNGLILQVGDKRVCLRGSAVPMQPKKKYQAPELIYADSINHVDKAFWEAWVAQMGKNYLPLKSGAIYASNTKAEVTSRAKDNENNKTGFERLDENNVFVKKLEER